MTDTHEETEHRALMFGQEFKGIASVHEITAAMVFLNYCRQYKLDALKLAESVRDRRVQP